jgi:hypothetical protein
MARTPRKDQTLGSYLKKAGVAKQALKTPTGRTVRKDAKIATLRKRSN